jgi:hypothetical protein
MSVYIYFYTTIQNCNLCYYVRLYLFLYHYTKL